jgi:hypothetical protein
LVILKKKLITIINLISASLKYHIELHCAQIIEIAHTIAIRECETMRGANKIGNLHRSGLLGEALILILFAT